MGDVKKSPHDSSKTEKRQPNKIWFDVFLSFNQETLDEQVAGWGQVGFKFGYPTLKMLFYPIRTLVEPNQAPS